MGTCVIVATLSIALQSTQAASGATHKLADYVAREWPGESHQQGITTTALTLLADAIEANAAVTLPSADVATRVGRLKQQIDDYRGGTPGNLDQSRRLRRIMIEASTLIEKLVTAAGLRQRPHDPRLNALERAAKSLSDEAPVLRQPDVLERFFRHAVEALARLEGSPGKV